MGEGEGSRRVTEIVAMRQRGHPLPLIAARFGITTQRVYGILRDAGAAEGCLHILYGDHVPKPVVRRADRAAELRERRTGIVAAYKDGMPVFKIMDRYHCSKQHVYEVISEAGVKPRGRQNGALVAAARP